MSIAEKVFRLVSIVALMIGFLIGMMSADKDVKIEHTMLQTESIIQDLKWQEVVNEINAGEMDSSRPVVSSTLAGLPQ